MTAPTTDRLQEDLRRHKELLSAATVEIEALRERVGKCATTIMETVMLEESQGSEIKFLRARVSELEVILQKFQAHSRAADQVLAAMRGAMDRMQETIRKVAGEAKKTGAAVGLSKQIEELEQVATAPPLPTDLERLIGPD